jgi:hypothetical protein
VKNCISFLRCIIIAVCADTVEAFIRTPVEKSAEYEMVLDSHWTPL